MTECGCESKGRAKYSRVCSLSNQVNGDAEMADTGRRAGFRRKMNFILYLVSLHIQVKTSIGNQIDEHGFHGKVGNWSYKSGRYLLPFSPSEASHSASSPMDMLFPLS